jgi:hypothetical protein
MRVQSMSLPLTCVRVRAPDSTRCGQGWKGYDTSHDTKFHRVNGGRRDRDCRGRPQLSRCEGRQSTESPFRPSAPLFNFYYFFSLERGFECNGLLASVDINFRVARDSPTTVRPSPENVEAARSVLGGSIESNLFMLGFGSD